MKTTLTRLVMGSVLILAPMFAGTASAVTVLGTVKALGTLMERVDGGRHARFRITIADSTCSTDSTPVQRTIDVWSGRMDGEFANRSANVHNAYSTLLVAFLTGSTVQITNVPSCDFGGQPQRVDLWLATITIS